MSWGFVIGCSVGVPFGSIGLTSCLAIPGKADAGLDYRSTHSTKSSYSSSSTVSHSTFVILRSLTTETPSAECRAASNGAATTVAGDGYFVAEGTA
jgi:hypothetical protein